MTVDDCLHIDKWPFFDEMKFVDESISGRASISSEVIIGKKTCGACRSKLKGKEALEINGALYHKKCFTCKECGKSLESLGFYEHGDNYYCKTDYQRMFGRVCQVCKKTAEGDKVVTALNMTFHMACFACCQCGVSLQVGLKVSYIKGKYYCKTCSEVTRPLNSSTPRRPELAGAPLTPASDTTLTNGQLSDTIPGYVIDTSMEPLDDSNRKDPNDQLKVIIPEDSKKNWQNIDKARPSFLQSTYIRHPTSSIPGFKTNANALQRIEHTNSIEVFDDTNSSFGHALTSDTRLSPNQTFMSYTSPSPALTNHTTFSRASSSSRHKDMGYGHHLVSTSYIQKRDEASLRESQRKKTTPVKPNVTSPHFHRPDNFSYSNLRRDFLTNKKGNTGLLNTLAGPVYKKKPTATENGEATNGEADSPAIKGTEEAIRLSRYPDGHFQCNIAAVDRDDWPAPPDPAVAYPELLRAHRHHRERKSSLGDFIDGRHRRSTSPRETSSRHEDEQGSTGEGVNRSRSNEGEEEMEDEVSISSDSDTDQRDPVAVAKNLKGMEALIKMKDSGAAKLVLKEYNHHLIDPRSASRTPSARKEPHFSTRYTSSTYASPSRFIDDNPKLHSLDDCITGPMYRSSGPFPSNYSGSKPGYSLSSCTSKGADGRRFTMDGADDLLTMNGHDTSNYYNSQNSIEYDEKTGLRRGIRTRSSTGEAMMSRSFASLYYRNEEPLKIYDYEDLKISNFRLPRDVDRDCIENHLCANDFITIFKMRRSDFNRLPEWKRNDIKKRVNLY